MRLNVSGVSVVKNLPASAQDTGSVPVSAMIPTDQN